MYAEHHRVNLEKAERMANACLAVNRMVGGLSRRTFARTWLKVDAKSTGRAGSCSEMYNHRRPRHARVPTGHAAASHHPTQPLCLRVPARRAASVGATRATRITRRKWSSDRVRGLNGACRFSEQTAYNGAGKSKQPFFTQCWPGGVGTNTVGPGQEVRKCGMRQSRL
ncbi:hypothetical protein C8R47DRAFT_1085236 [Mycena vitilis]|nr:hypothetical protein C8R47DRAFT_1085236 [Mycena vitilis]